jgi:broad specificity phosphatase PhoE
MSALRLILVRHGMPEIVEGVPSAEWRLSNSGRIAAAALADNLRGFAFDHVASSPEPKAIGTADALAAQLGLSVEVDAGFAEHARRSVGFLSREQLDSNITALFARPDTLVFGDETADQAYDRFCAALQRQRTSGARDIVAVTHGTILSIYVGRILGIDPLPFWRALTTPAAVILEAGQMRVIAHAD